MQIGISAFLQGQTKMSKTDKKQLHTVYGDDVFPGVVFFFLFWDYHATKIHLKTIFSAGVKTP